MGILILLLLLAIPSSVQAFDESFPEFISLNELEQARFDNPSRLGAEYQSDVYAFQKPWNWQYQWLSKPVAFDTTFGSISAVHFLMDTRVKMRAELSRGLEFRLLHFDERNHDREAVHTVFELAWFPWKKIGISGYGQPSYNKRENDVGLALLFRPSEHHEIRAFHTWVDLTRQKRSDRTDTFERDSLPYARGIVGRVVGGAEKKNFFEYAVRSESLSKWNFPDQLYSYRHRRDLASLYYSREMSAEWRLNLRLQADRKFEARDPTSAASAQVGEAWTTDRVLFQLQTPLYAVLPERFELIPSLQYARRNWDSTIGKLTYDDVLLGVFLKLPSQWIFDYSITHHGKRNGVTIGQAGDEHAVVHQRIDVGYAFSFNDQSELRIRAGFDLDKLGTRETWEAGVAQFRWAL